MQIGINASSASKENRTGVEEYTYQFIKNLAMLPENREHQFFLYAKESFLKGINLPDNFSVKKINFPILWTQGGLAFDFLLSKPDVFFSPCHVLPFFCPKKSIVVIHGLEFERFPGMYPFFHGRYLKIVTKHAVSRSDKIIAVSQNTKKDIIELYGVSPDKIIVINHGVDIPDYALKNNKKYDFPFILFLGTKEKKKNIFGLMKAFDIIKGKYHIPHKLVLAGGKPNPKFYKEENIREIAKKMKFGNDVVNLGFVSENEKWNLLKNSEVFVYPSFYEGFGMPVLEAQSAGVPVVTSDRSALPEVAGKGALLINPLEIEEIADAIYKIISDSDFRKNLAQMGMENAKKFSWKECAKKTLDLLILN